MAESDSSGGNGSVYMSAFLRSSTMASGEVEEILLGGALHRSSWGVLERASIASIPTLLAMNQSHQQVTSASHAIVSAQVQSEPGFILGFGECNYVFFGQ